MFNDDDSDDFWAILLWKCYRICCSLSSSLMTLVINWWYMLAMVPHLGSAGVVGILKQVPEPPLHPWAVVVPKLLVQIIILNTGTLSIEIVYIEVKVGELYRKCFAWLVSDFWSNFIFLHTYMIQLDYIYSLKSLKFFTTLRTF